MDKHDFPIQRVRARSFSVRIHLPEEYRGLFGNLLEAQITNVTFRHDIYDGRAAVHKVMFIINSLETAQATGVAGC